MSLSDLNFLKSKLDLLESKINIENSKNKEREEKLTVVNSIYDEHIKKQDKITFNVSGTLFTTSAFSIKQHTDTLFNAILEDFSIDKNEPIFLDRNPQIFKLLLNYIRKKNINTKILSKQEIFDLANEAHYFELWDLFKLLNDLSCEVEFVSLDFTGTYIFKNEIAGTNKLEDLSSKDDKTGVCSKSPGVITIGFNKECTFDSFMIRGFTGDTRLWNVSNGSSSKILVSLDGNKWISAGNLGTINKDIKTKTLDNEVTARYIKFENNSYLGIGYLKIIEKN